MASKRNQDASFLPVDIIDLTQDSPINLSRRQDKNSTGPNGSTRRTRASQRNRPNVTHDLFTGESQPTELSLDVVSDIINLDDTFQSDLANSTAASAASKEKILPTICPICLEELSTALKPMSTRCGHMYCSDCLRETLKRKKKCPKCQSSITERTCIRLYL